MSRSHLTQRLVVESLASGDDIQEFLIELGHPRALGAVYVVAGQEAARRLRI